MVDNKLSYAEAYTEFIKYCSNKEKVAIGVLIEQFRNNGIEKEFRMLYNNGIKISNTEYYKRIRGK